MHEPGGQHSKSRAETSTFCCMCPLSPKCSLCKIPCLTLQAPPAPGFLAAIQPLRAIVLFQRGVCRLELLSNSVEDSQATVWIWLPPAHSAVTHLPCIFWLLPSPVLFSLTLRVYVPLVLYCHFSGLQKGEEIRNTCASFP